MGRKDYGQGNNDILNENIEEEDNEIQRKSRKRKPDTTSWTRQKCKIQREKGEKYDGLRKNAEGKWTFDVAKPPREMKPFCNCKMSEKSKKIQCQIFTEEDRKHIF